MLRDALRVLCPEVRGFFLSEVSYVLVKGIAIRGRLYLSVSRRLSTSRSVCCRRFYCVGVVVSQIGTLRYSVYNHAIIHNQNAMCLHISLPNIIFRMQALPIQLTPA